MAELKVNKTNKTPAEGKKIWEKFQFAIFDVDGTIFDNMEFSANVFCQTLRNFNLPQNKIRKIYLETNGMNLDDQLKLVLSCLSPACSVSRADRKKYNKGYSNSTIKILHKKFFHLRDNSPKWKSTPLFSGVKNLLKKLNKENLKIFTSSGSNTDELISRFKKAKISQYFTLVLGAEKIPKGPGHIQAFAKHLGLSAKNFSKNAFWLSDGPEDMKIAKKSKIFAIGIAGTVNKQKLKSAGADVVISNIGKVINL